MVTPDDQWLRFDDLAWAGQMAPAERQVARLDPTPRRAAEARLALKRDAADADARYAALSQAQRDEPAMMLERARYLRRAGQDTDALALWNSAGVTAQSAAPVDRLPAYWAERAMLLRRVLRNGDAVGAYRLANDHGQREGEGLVDAEFIAGYLALRRLNDPTSATKHFRALARASKSAITQGRAHYWLGRAAAAAKLDPAPDFTAAAQWSTTFYGQLAALSLGETPAQLNARIVGLHDPGWSRDQVLGFAEREVTRATVTLAAWGELRRSHVFALRLDEIAPDPADRSLAARLALGVGETDQAVMIARRAGRDGLMLPESGWPVTFDPPSPTVEPALVLGIIRQESNFDTEALSPSGARGLMQLMPATAKTVAKLVGEPTSIGALTADPDHNMRLGSAYLRSLLDSFDGSMPLAIAAYNAGPSRVEEWIGTNGDPRQGPQGQAGLDAMLDWIELIPFNETRNYVQRVIENVVVYRARLQKAHGGPVEPPPISP
jgi:soluble lytic murein transglycosylase